MAEVINQIGSLTTLKRELKKNRIEQFNSVKDISEFERTFEKELLTIKKKVRSDLLKRLESMAESVAEHKKLIDQTTEDAKSNIDRKIRLIQDRRFALRIYHEGFSIRYLFDYILDVSLRRKSRGLSKRRSSYVLAQVFDELRILRNVSDAHNDLRDNFDEHFKRIEIAQCRDLWHAKETIESLRPTILGTIGENRVSSTLASLPQGYTVINDVNVKLDRPIYNRNENDRIYSFQIDHVVVSTSGIFVIETKHWSKQSIANRDLFSPVKQVRRSGYALFTIINSAIRDNVIRINDSWGTRSVSVRNIIAFSASSTNKKFEHVKLLDIESLIGYIEWFKPELSESDARKITAYIRKISI